MRYFKIFWQKNSVTQILLTSYSLNENNNVNLYSTFNEHFAQAEHDQCTLTFSIAAYINNYDSGSLYQRNKLLQLLQFGSKIKLENDDASYNLIISDITPVLGKKNTIYTFTCQDELSYKLSKIHLGYTYDNSTTGVETLETIFTKVVRENNLNWQVNILDKEFNDSHKITLTVENSNPYNVLIEACNSCNCYLKVDYKNRYLSYYNRQSIKFSGYRYRPEVNSKQFDVSYSATDMASILHVSGGTDEHDKIVTMVPNIPDAYVKYFTTHQTEILNKTSFSDTWYSDIKYIVRTSEYMTHTMPLIGDVLYDIKKEQYEKELQTIDEFCSIATNNPSLNQFLFDFSFFRKCKMLSDADYNNLLKLINVDMRKNNIFLKIATVPYYTGIYNISKYLTDVVVTTEEYESTGASIPHASKVERENLITVKNDIYDNKIARTILTTNLPQLFTTIYGFTKSTNQEPYPYINLLPEYTELKNKQLSYAAIRDDAYANYLVYQRQYIAEKGFPYIGVDNDVEINESLYPIESNILYYKNRYESAVRLCGYKSTLVPASIQNKWYAIYSTFVNGEDSDTLIDITLQLVYDGVQWVYHAVEESDILSPFIYENQYDLLFSKLNTSCGEWINNNSAVTINTLGGIYKKVLLYEDSNQFIWSRIYNLYGDFIYESKYEDENEIDSISLYNQAVAYYEDYNKPAASYSATVLSLSTLEAINIPNLTVGSMIRIYNEELNLNDPELVDGTLIENFNNIQFTNNNLVVTSLEYDLRNSGEISVGVEKVTPYSQILTKLIKAVK